MARQDHPALAAYRAKRDPSRTPEPFGRLQLPPTGKLFVVQQHAARQLHFDLRLEVDGVLKSWAIPKGLSADPEDKRLAVETEDHPLDYADFEGAIPAGNYGAGHVIVWDRGTYDFASSFVDGMAKGKLLFDMRGLKLHGRWTLVRLKQDKQWLCIKEHDDYVNDPRVNDPNSVLSGLNVRQLKNPTPKIAALNRQLAATKRSREAAIDAISTRPMLATSGTPHRRRGWVWELKYDGYRVILRKSQDRIEILSRNGHDMSARFPEIRQILSRLPIRECVVDGELVVHDSTLKPRFALIQDRARAMSAYDIQRAAILQPASVYCFDLLFANGFDLRKAPLLERKRRLQQLLPTASHLIFSEHIEQDGLHTFATAQRLGVEGVVGKRGEAPYQHGRSSDWIKARHQRTEDFVVIGWTGSQSNPSDIGALALAEYRGEQLFYVGHAGSGLTQALRAELGRSLRRLARKTNPAQNRVKKATHWVRPRLVVEVAYAEYTHNGNLRHPVIVRLRDDKDAHACTGAFDVATLANVTATGPEKVTVTNPDKLFFPDAHLCKIDLVKYYRDIAPWLLPHLHDRPIVLTRYPDGVTGKSFYQRDLPDYVPPWMRRETLWSNSNDKSVQYPIAQTAEDLAFLANLGTIPIHMWHSRVGQLDYPDWCVLDLDPKKAPFSDVITLANAIGELADEIALPAFIKTSGASGLHVMIPLSQQITHAQSQVLGELLAHTIVERYDDIATIARSVKARANKVYIDYLQNGHGRLIAAPFAVRAEPLATVSMPLNWHEVKKGLTNSRFHIKNAVARMKRLKQDPLAAIHTSQPDLVRSLHLLGSVEGR